MSTPHMTFETVRTEDGFKRLDAFAESFDHKIMTRRHPITLFKREGKIRGYFATSFDPLIMPAWHTDPNICNPRDIVEGLRAVASWGLLQHGGGFCITPLENTPFTPELMGARGFLDMKSRIFEMTN